ncbi:Os08g0422600, partial [Oryza sativa Japonica Group]
FVILTLKNRRSQVWGVSLLAVRSLQVLQRRRGLGSLAGRRTAAAKAQRYRWANRVPSPRTNTIRRERMRAVWGTRMYRASRLKDPRFVVATVARPWRFLRRQGRNPRRRTRRLESQSKAVSS